MRILFVVLCVICWSGFGLSNKRLYQHFYLNRLQNGAPVSESVCKNIRNNTCPHWIGEAIAEIEKASRCFSKTPIGMVIGIVQNRSEPIVTNIGYAETEPVAKPITMETKFAIGSLTKAFTATLLGMLLSEQESKYPKTWDTKIIDIMGKNYSLIDELRSKQCTVLDILAHRVGLQTYNLVLQAGLDPKIPLQEYCKRLHHVEKSGLFRSRYEYNNIMFLLASCVAEKLGNGSFSNLMKEKIFKPLGMNDTEFIPDTRRDGFKNLATMYFVNEKNEIEPISREIFRSIDTLMGAGGIVSTGRDMCKWMKFQLNSGRNEQGKQLIPVSYWLDLHSRYMINRRPGMAIEKPNFPVTSSLRAFGLGWRVGHYRGFRQSEHSGDLGSFSSKITLLNRMGVGVFTITNGPAYYTGDLQATIHYYLLDKLLQVEPWLNNSTMCSFPRPWVGGSYSRQQPVVPVKPVVTNHSVEVYSNIASYVGQYGHPIFGNFTIYRNASALSDSGRKNAVLWFTMGEVGTGRLEFRDLTNATVEFTGAMRYIWTLVKARYPIVVSFKQLDHSTKKYQTVSAYGFEPNAPVTFKRGLKWVTQATIPKSLSSRLSSLHSYIPLIPGIIAIVLMKDFLSHLWGSFVTL